MRKQVLREETTCWLCGQPASPGDPLVADHITPRAHGGGNERANYHAAHHSCNNRRGARDARDSHADADGIALFSVMGDDPIATSTVTETRKFRARKEK
jgi:HNH endonuclease